MKYRYKARNPQGTIETGIVEAVTEANAIETLQNRGLVITGLEKAERKKGVKKEIKIFSRKVKGKELVFFYRELSILVTSGTPLVEALNALSEQVQNAVLKEQTIDIANNVNGGMAFSEALSHHPETFTRFIISMVKVGEVGGNLSTVLEYLADHKEREYTLISKVKGAMYYPAAILIACAGVLVIMLTFVMPRVSKMFADFETELPLPTKIIIYSSDFFSKYFWVFLILAIIAIWLILRYIKTPKGKETKDKIMLKVPVIGLLFRNMYYARMSENLSTLVKGGIPIVQALDTVSEVVGNSLFQDTLKMARDNVRKGGDISSIFKESEVITPTFAHMVKSGEKSGKLHKVLEDLAAFYNKEVSRQIDNLMSVLEPILLIAIGLVVAFLAIAVIMPIYNLVGVIG
jgi:type IV pilus assembly protein PilC